MGGIAILGAAFLGWLIPHGRAGLVFSDQVIIMWVAIFVLAGIGFLDDYLKVRRQHNRGIFGRKGLDHLRHRCALDVAVGITNGCQ